MLKKQIRMRPQEHCQLWIYFQALHSQPNNAPEVHLEALNFPVPWKGCKAQDESILCWQVLYFHIWWPYRRGGWGASLFRYFTRAVQNREAKRSVKRGRENPLGSMHWLPSGKITGRFRDLTAWRIEITSTSAEIQLARGVRLTCYWTTPGSGTKSSAQQIKEKVRPH